jgi:hypothetical protein
MQMYVNANMIPVGNVSEIGGGGIKENSWGREFKYDIFDTF